MADIEAVPTSTGSALCRVRPSSTEFGPSSGRVRPNSTGFGSLSVNFDRDSAKFGRCRPAMTIRDRFVFLPRAKRFALSATRSGVDVGSSSVGVDLGLCFHLRAQPAVHCAEQRTKRQEPVHALRRPIPCRSNSVERCILPRHFEAVVEDYLLETQVPPSYDPRYL